MENANRVLALVLAVLFGGLLGGCSSAAYSATVRPPKLSPSTAASRPPPEQSPSSYVAQTTTCWSTMSCCIQNHPLTAAESCGASALDIAEALNGARVVHQATKTDDNASTEADGAQEDDFANNAHLPEWKQECIRNYVACKSEPDWRGPCYDCLRRCEGQQQWPFKMCSPPSE